MQARLILGPAGSGKTFRCLTEIRAALAAGTDGPPLLLVAPRQTTYQLERQLLADPALPGYTRLHILSFERLAFFILDRLGKPQPQLLDEEGRVMVLRGLLARKRHDLKLFRASARLTGFAQHLSLALRELQRRQLTPESILQLAEQARPVESLSRKLEDLALLLREYLDWLADRGLQDADNLLDVVTQTLRAPHEPLALGGLWVDGFSDLAPQELDLLSELVPESPDAAISFCLDEVPAQKISWLSHWSVVRQMFHQCRDRLARLPNCKLETELLARAPRKGRFGDSPVLSLLEANWAEPKPFGRNPTGHGNPVNPGLAGNTFSPTGGEGRVEGDLFPAGNPGNASGAIRIARCANPEAEAVLAAREILQFVRSGGRYREVTVLARELQDYHSALVNTFTRYEIPFFLDRRESVARHPLAELTRSALRTLASSWAHDDWFAALKTGLVPADEADVDRLENEALARGWKGVMWLKPIVVPDAPELSDWLEPLRQKITRPFNKLAIQLGRQKNKPNGEQLAGALRDFWQALNVEETLRQWASQENEPLPIHITVWEQMNTWLANLELAFPDESQSLHEWLPILDAGLAGLSVGVIPPALDQVTIGAIDRSRNPDIRLALILGMNEGIFPAAPAASVLLTDTDRAELERHGVSLANPREQISRERFYGYVACTRARERLVLVSSENDAAGKALNRSPFLAHVHQLFPKLEEEIVPRALDWRESEHASELIGPLLRHQLQGTSSQVRDLAQLQELPALAALRERLGHLAATPPVELLSPALAARLYGAALRTSVSRMEQFAACPFKFFVHSGLRAEERRKFEMDVRDQGSFQHDVLANFHEELHKEGKRWRDITPAEARERIKRIAAAMALSFRFGLFQSDEQSRFTARVLAEALQDFVETIVGWMRRQYAFDPAAVELSFGETPGPFPAWELDLGGGHKLQLHGRIDRVDLCREGTGDDALCVVVDYKSGEKQLDSLLMQHGLQLQLAAYLNVLRHWPNPQPVFGVTRLTPAGVFYVNLRGKYEQGKTRDIALAKPEMAREAAYRHTGRYDAGALGKLDKSFKEKDKGDQFGYWRNKDGSLSKKSREALESGAFTALLDAVESSLKKMGQDIYAGVAKVDPYQKGRTIACDECDYRAVCRIDPWTHSYRILRKNGGEEEAE